MDETVGPALRSEDQRLALEADRRLGHRLAAGGPGELSADVWNVPLRPSDPSGSVPDEPKVPSTLKVSVPFSQVARSLHVPMIIDRSSSSVAAWARVGIAQSARNAAKVFFKGEDPFGWRRPQRLEKERDR